MSPQSFGRAWTIDAPGLGGTCAFHSAGRSTWQLCDCGASRYLVQSIERYQEGRCSYLSVAFGVFSYQVVATKIVRPTDVSVLRPDGGGLIANPGKLLTMITCYPFYYVGSAPKDLSSKHR